MKKSRVFFSCGVEDNPEEPSFDINVFCWFDNE